MYEMPSVNRPAPLVAVKTCTMLANGAIASTISASSTFSMYAPLIAVAVRASDEHLSVLSASPTP